ncbi:MAG: uroporphyrinogen-III synthase [Phenylobacterium sp.]|nr:uroporphyrinogen-III synthase [Phenylobacterium sp.]
MNRPAPRVWVTRTMPAALRTADRLRAFGLRPELRPLLEVRPVDGQRDLSGVGALAFSSVNGVREFARRERRRDLPVFAVGDATAQAALVAGFPQVRSASGDVGDLARLILDHRARIRGHLLWAGAREPAGDLAGALAPGGVETRTCVVYETASVMDDAEIAAVLDDAADPFAAVLVHSPRAGRRLAEALVGPRQGLEFVCISSAAAGPLAAKGLSARTADRPNEAQMLRRLLEALGERADWRTAFTGSPSHSGRRVSGRRKRIVRL